MARCNLPGLDDHCSGGLMNRLLVVDQNKQFFRKIEKELKHSCDAECFHVRNKTEASAMLESSRPFGKILVGDCLEDGSGLDFIRFLSEAHPSVTVVAIADSLGYEQAVAAFGAGAQGFLLKSEPFIELVHHLHGWFVGIVPIAPSVTKGVLEQYCPPCRGASEKHDSGATQKFAGFSRRECEVLHLLIAGTTTKEIALRLTLSPTTVLTHIKHIYEKLNVNSRAAAVAAVMGRRGNARPFLI